MRISFKNLTAILLGILLPVVGIAQKKIIDTNVYGKWPSVNDHLSQISNDGNYVMYDVDYQPVNSQTLIINAVHKNWKITLSGARQAFFSDDNRKVVIEMSGDSLGIFTLGRPSAEYVQNLKPNSVNVTKNWLCYRLNNLSQELVIRNLRTGTTRKIAGTEDYVINHAANILVVKTKPENDSSGRKLLCIDLAKDKTTAIWQGKDCSHFTFNEVGNQLVFFAEKTVNQILLNSIWTYDTRDEEAKQGVINVTRQGFSIIPMQLNFSGDGRKIFFYIIKNQKVLRPPKLVYDGVTIRNYKDKYMQPQPHNDFDPMVCAYDLFSKQITFLNEADENVIFAERGGRSNHYVLIYRNIYPDNYYNKEDRPDLYLVSITDGSRKLVKKAFYCQRGDFKSAMPFLSPDEKFISWFDEDSSAYISYEIETRIQRNISKSVPVALYDTDAAQMGRYYAYGPAGWVNNNRYILLYSKYDIWKTDLLGKDAPFNLTHGAGEKLHVVFALTNIDPQTQNDGLSIVDLKRELWLGAYNRDTKENGFWKLNPDSKAGPEKLLMDSTHAYWIGRNALPEGDAEAADGMKPIKARDERVYLVQRESASEAPNLLVTNDFKTFKKVSDIHPEKAYNWLTTELITWKLPDGQLGQGILYKPENFDPKKKYPLIFDYYVKRSDQLNKFIMPKYAGDRIDIPTYVSNGYLIFVPDIYYVAGHNGEGVLNSVVSAARYFENLSYIDSTKMGLQGHSYGGWETNYIITHSHLFAAACEAAGNSDQISVYGQLNGFIGGEHWYAEEGDQGTPYGVGNTPWTKPELYIAESPIFNIGNITTPLLIEHNPKDAQVPFAQAIELFTGMKRAGKKVWLLSYDNEGHSIFDAAAKDYTIRMQQFFDYYLKGAPAPVWMTRVIKKGAETGLEIDTTGTKP